MDAQAKYLKRLQQRKERANKSPFKKLHLKGSKKPGD